MGTKYDFLKVATIAGTLFSVYHTLTDQLLLEDLIIVLLIAITFVYVAKESSRKKAGFADKFVQGELTEAVEEAIKKQLAA